MKKLLFMGVACILIVSLINSQNLLKSSQNRTIRELMQEMRERQKSMFNQNFFDSNSHLDRYFNGFMDDSMFPNDPLFDRLDEIFKHKMNSPNSQNNQNDFWGMPNGSLLNITENETDDYYEILIDTNGKQMDFTVEVVGNTLMIKSQSKTEEENNDPNHKSYSSSFSSFTQSMILPEYINPLSKVEKMENNIYIIRFSKNHSQKSIQGKPQNNPKIQSIPLKIQSEEI